MSEQDFTAEPRVGQCQAGSQFFEKASEKASMGSAAIEPVAEPAVRGATLGDVSKAFPGMKPAIDAAGQVLGIFFKTFVAPMVQGAAVVGEALTTPEMKKVATQWTQFALDVQAAIQERAEARAKALAARTARQRHKRAFASARPRTRSRTRSRQRYTRAVCGAGRGGGDSGDADPDQGDPPGPSHQVIPFPNCLEKPDGSSCPWRRPGSWPMAEGGRAA
jgi:hypothetical protein